MIIINGKQLDFKGDRVFIDGKEYVPKESLKKDFIEGEIINEGSLLEGSL